MPGIFYLLYKTRTLSELPGGLVIKNPILSLLWGFCNKEPDVVIVVQKVKPGPGNYHKDYFWQKKKKKTKQTNKKKQTQLGPFLSSPLSMEKDWVETKEFRFVSIWPRTVRVRKSLMLFHQSS